MLTLPRLSFGVIGRLPRVTPEPGAAFNGYAVPAGVSLDCAKFYLGNPFFNPSHLRRTLLTMYADHRWNERLDDAPKRKHISFARQI
jgi:hypothetical protein